MRGDIVGAADSSRRPPHATSPGALGPELQLKEVVMPRPTRFAAAIALSLMIGVFPTAVSGKSDAVRFATFNASLNRNAPGLALAQLSSPGNAQASAVAEIIQRIRPDVLLINEFDFEPNGALAEVFQENYLSHGQNGAEAIEYGYWFVAPSNTGIHSGLDFDNNGIVNPTPNVPSFPPTNASYGNDSFGFGDFPGQFGMAVFSRFPIRYDEVRTFQHFLWKDMPNAMLPNDPTTPAAADWYSPAELAVFRLSSKSHWDVPIQIGRKVVHFLASHPTPPVFDGPEDRNGTRNNDEIRLWADYITPGPTSAYIYDDEGTFGGLKAGELFVIAGDQNSDPLDGDSVKGSIQQLLDHPLVNTKVTPESAGAIEASALQGGANATHKSDPRYDTADFADGAPGNLRADYVLPRISIAIQDSAVFWPTTTDPLFRLTGVFPFPSSDHRSVWVDVLLPG
jgi:Endonuclease/Exonuclease/phosphatase family